MTQDVIEKGNLRYTKRTKSTTGIKYQPCLFQCPACGQAFEGEDGVDRSTHLLNEHDPEDFGL